MSKIIYYFLFLIKIILKFRLELHKPRQKKYLIIDKPVNDFFKIINKKDCNILYRRGEKLNLPILIECILELKMNSLNYHLKYIKYSKPKLIITFFDSIKLFYLLSELTKIKTLMFQYGSKSNGVGIFSKKNFNSKKNYKKFFVDYIFVHNISVSNIFNKFVRGKKIVIGTIQNNFCNLQNKKKKEILLLSNYRPLSKSWNKGDELVIKQIYNLSKKNNVKFNILGRMRKNDLAEKNYYSEIINDKFNYISLISNPNSYDIMQKYEYVFTCFATMAKENLARGGKTGIIFYKPYPMQKKLRNHGYGVFEGLANNGPFWSNMIKLDSKTINKIFYFVTKGNNRNWQNARSKFIKCCMEFDLNNKTLYKIIKKNG